MNVILDYIGKFHIEQKIEEIKKYLYEYTDELSYFANMYNEEELDCEFDYFENSSDFDILKEKYGFEFDNYLECILYDKIITLLDDIQIEDNHLIIHRGISIENKNIENIIDSFNNENEIDIGYCWSKDILVCHEFAFTSDKNISSSIIISSKIHIDKVDFEHTMMLNCLGETGEIEKEIRLKNNSKVKIEKLIINNNELEKLNFELDFN